jgi:hypothetical protein
MLSFKVYCAMQSQQLDDPPVEESQQMHSPPAGKSQQMHDVPVEGSQQMQGGMNQGLIGNNMLGSPPGLAAGGLAAVVIMGAITFAIAAFVISWKQRSFVVAGLLAASGIILMILPLANMNVGIPGPIIGVIVGLVILGLGVAKGITTAKPITVASR